MNVGLPLADIAQLGERQTEDLKVAGSIPAVGNRVFLFTQFLYFYFKSAPPSQTPKYIVPSMRAGPLSIAHCDDPLCSRNLFREKQKFLFLKKK